LSASGSSSHDLSLAAFTINIAESNFRHTQRSITIQHDDQGNRSVISENTFNHFAEVHATMKRNKGKAFVVIIPKTAKPMEIQAFHNLKQLGYVVEAR
jgi:hypothetical protein